MQLDAARDWSGPRGIFSLTERSDSAVVEAAALRLAGRLSFEDYRRTRVQLGQPVLKNRTCSLLEDVGLYFPICTTVVTIPFGPSRCPVAHFGDTDVMFEFYRSCLCRSGLLEAPPPTPHIEPWAGFLDGRTLRVGEMPQLDSSARRFLHRNNDLQTVVGGIRPIYSALGHSPDSFFPWVVGAGKDDYTGLYWLEQETHFFQHLFALTGKEVQRPDGNGTSHIYTNLVLDGAAYNAYFGIMSMDSNECACCGLTEREYARPLTEPRPARAGRPTMLGLPVMSFEDWRPVYTPPDPIIDGALLHHPIFRVVWGPRHALAHEVSDYLEFTVDLLQASDVPKRVINDYIAKVRANACKKWSPGRVIAWKQVKQLLDKAGLPRVPTEFDLPRFLDDPNFEAPRLQPGCINSLAEHIERQISWFRTCGDHHPQAPQRYKVMCDEVHMRWVALFPSSEPGQGRMRLSTHQALHEFPRVWLSLGPDAPDLCSEESGEAAHHLAKDIWYQHSTRTTTNPRRRGYLSGWVDLLRTIVQSWTFWCAGALRVHWAGHLRKAA